jgi:hypothetical protein
LTECDDLPSKDIKVTTDGNVTVAYLVEEQFFEGWADMKQMRVSKFLGGKCQDGQCPWKVDKMYNPSKSTTTTTIIIIIAIKTTTV